MIIYNVDLNTFNTFQYKINDKSFRTEKIFNIPDILNDRNKLTDFFSKNSVVRGLFKDNDNFIIVSEIGEFDYNEQLGFNKTQKNRKIKLYFFDSDYVPIRTILYDYFFSTKIEIFSNAMYFFSLNTEHEEQMITLNRFSFFEE